MTHFSISLLCLLLHFTINNNFAEGLEIRELNFACSTCIQKSPRFWYSCSTCYDNKDEVSYCGYTINNMLECPRANR